MAKKKSYITLTDQFCGAGGSSQGAKKVLDKVGGHIRLALNHWKLAIETHNTNFPDTDHDCTDISASDPRRYPSTDGLITSPECTTHSPAGGNNHKALKKQMEMFSTGAIDPATERSRATMWDVCRFAEYHRYNFIIVENVVEAKTRWALFDDWLRCMHTLGYNHKCVYQNSMHHFPTPQSRDRMYIVFWKKGNKAPVLDYTPLAFCNKCGCDINAIQTWKRHNVQYGKYRLQYLYCCPVCSSVVEPYYHASFNCIDWTDTGTKIGERKKPLRPNTIKRINYGLEKYPNESLVVKLSHSKCEGDNCRPVLKEMRTQTTTDDQAIINLPFIINDQNSTGIGYRVRGMLEPVQVVTTTPHLKLCIPHFLTELHSNGKTRALGAEINTVTAQGIKNGIVHLPFLTQLNGMSKTTKITDAINTQTSTEKNGIVTTECWQSFIAQYYGGSNCVSHFTEATGTVRTNEGSALVTYQKPNIEDCYYRMLKPHEIKLAMAFDKEYKILGSGKNQVKQLGNAVTPPVMEWLTGQCVASLL